MASRRPPRHKPLTDEEGRPRPLTPDETIGSRIRGYREQAGMRLIDLAGKAGTSESYLSRIETGQRPASRELIAAIVRALRSSATPIRIKPEDITRHAGDFGIEAEIGGTTARASIPLAELAPELRALVRRCR